MKSLLLLFFNSLALLVFAQKPNPALRLPLSPDMPEFAKPIYRDDVEVNVFALDRQFAPWKRTYDSLKIEMNRVGDAASEPFKAQFFRYKVYSKYYTRWRNEIRPFIQPDGSLLFSEDLLPEFEPQPNAQQRITPDWSLLGPTRTLWAKNDNAAQPSAPWQANIFTIAVAPSDANTLLYGTATGLVGISTDKGLNWTTVGLNYFTGASMRGAAIHPTNTSVFYIGDEKGVHTSTDAGATWSQALNVANFNTNDIKIKPDDGEVVLAAGSSLRRRTAGNVWTTILNARTYDLAFKPGDPSTVYALVRNANADLCEFWKSTDGGQTFSIRSTGWISGLTDGGGRMTVTTADGNRIYAVLLTGSGPRVMRSNDAGETWSIIASSSELGLIGPCTSGALSMSIGQGFYDLAIVASQTNADHIILGTTTSFKSTDGGATYSPMGGYCGPFSTHPDFQKMLAVGSDTWIATDGGINYSSDFFTSTANHEARILGMGGTDFWGFDQGWNEDVQVGGKYHNGNTARRESYPAGEHLRMGGGEAPTGYLNPFNAGMAYFSDLGGRMLPATINSTFSNFTVSKFPNENFYDMESSEQEWDPRYAYTYFLGKDNILWKTTDNGASFTALFTHSDATAKVQHIEISRTDPNVQYCTIQRTSSGELWKTTNGGTTWTQCANPTGPTASQRSISTISLSGTDANTIWWCFRNGPNGSKIFKSTDGGATWSNLTTATLNGFTISDMVHQLGTNGGIYICSNTGKVYYRNAAATDWTLYNSGLPVALYSFPSLLRLKIFYKGNKLRMSTNKGLWEADLFENSMETLPQPMVDNNAPSCSRDTLQLESYSVVSGAATYQWSFSPAPQWISNANIRNPRIVLGATAGYFSATLTVTDNNGTATRTISNFINNLPAGNGCGPDTIPGKSLRLASSGDYAQPSANLNLNSNTVSMTAWVKRNGAQVHAAGMVFARGGTTTSGLSISSSNALFYTWDDAPGSYSFNTGFTIPDNTWTHIALVITPTNAKVYMNGVAATRTAAHPAEAFDTPVKIGYDNGSRYFKGEIDEVTVWNKSLSQNEIRELMHLTAIPANQPNLVSYYQFNEPSGNALDKVSTRHATFFGSATRVTSTAPVGGGKSNRQTVTAAGTVNFTGTDVALGFPATGTYPNGEIVVSRINLAPDSLPACSAFASDNHYWIIENYGSNQTFSALSSAQFGNFAVPATSAIPATSYRLNRRAANAHLLPWTLLPSSSTAATGGAAGNISFGTATDITQFGQFLATNTLSNGIISGPASVCSGNNATLDAGAGFSTYAWSNSGGSGQTATFSNITAPTTFTVTVTNANACTGSATFSVNANANPTPTITGPTTVASGGNVTLDAGAGFSTYAWSESGGSGQTATFSNITAPTTFTVTVTNANACTGTDTETVAISGGTDVDNDGYTVGNGDCDDDNNSINPGATEVCNDMDDDCDSQIDEENVNPTALCKNLQIMLNASGEASVTSAQIDNGSSDDCTLASNLVLSLSKSNFTCSDLGGQSVTLSVEDEAGNTANCIATVTVLDLFNYTETPGLRTSPDGASLDKFGWSTGIAGNVAIAGAPEDKVGTTTKQGSAHLFVRDQGGAGNWGHIKQIKASDGAASDQFGRSVALDADYAFSGSELDNVGANTDQGSAYIFKKDFPTANNWGQLKQIKASDGEAYEYFGNSMFADGGRMLVGAHSEKNGATTNIGAAYLFEKDLGGSDNWGERKKLVASDRAASHKFGASVSLSGNCAIVGAPGHNSSRGAAYIFKKDQGGTDNWGEAQKLAASDAATGDLFGSSVHVSGDWAIVGAYGKLSSRGYAYIFQKDQGGTDNWGQVARIGASDGAGGNRFGWSVKISGEYAYIGAYIAGNQGAVYVFYKDAGGTNAWGQIAKYVPTGISANDQFGYSVAASGTEFIAGSPSDDIAAKTDQGSMYVFTGADCGGAPRAGQADNQALVSETALERGSEAFALRCQPTPFRDELNIEIGSRESGNTGADTGFDIQVMDATGKVATKMTLPPGQKTWRWQTGDAPAGLYFVQVSGEAGVRVLPVTLVR